MDKFAKEINRRIDEINDDDLSNRVNILQTMIYKFRQSKYLIPDWFESKIINIYKRQKHEKQDNVFQKVEKENNSLVFCSQKFIGFNRYKGCHSVFINAL